MSNNFINQELDKSVQSNSEKTNHTSSIKQAAKAPKKTELTQQDTAQSNTKLKTLDMHFETNKEKQPHIISSSHSEICPSLHKAPYSEQITSPYYKIAPLL